MMTRHRVALIGAGAIGRSVLGMVQDLVGSPLVIETVMTRTPAVLPAGVANVHTLQALIATRPEVVVDCAGAQAFDACVAKLLAQGIDVLSVSSAAMARESTARQIEDALALGRGRLSFASGAIAGLDLLTAAREGGLDRVEVIQRKPPAALLPAQEAAQLTAPRVIQQATAREVALALPANSNVAAAAAIAGIGFDRTVVTVIADPAVSRNMVELEASGTFGSLRLVIENRPSPYNPKTSVTPAMSIVAALRRRVEGLRIPG